MSLVLRRSYLKVRNNGLCFNNPPVPVASSIMFGFTTRSSSDSAEKNQEYSSTTILVENSLNVQELPVVIRRIRDFDNVCMATPTDIMKPTDSNNYRLIQAEFKECLALRDIFTLLSKCTQITPNIALGAMERISDLEKNPNPLESDLNSHANLAKGAIVEKLLKVVMKTEDTQTIINALNAESSFIDHFRGHFCDELLLRVTDNKLNVAQICEFMNFLVVNKGNDNYSHMIDKLWVGFIERENEINEDNISTIFGFLPHMKESKRLILNMLEHKLSEVWFLIESPRMHEILNCYLQLNYWSQKTFSYAGRWLNTNIHKLDDDCLLEIITKFNKLDYTDSQIEKSVERYVRMRRAKIESPILIVGILNYCSHFHIRNGYILNYCSEYFMNNYNLVSNSFLKSLVYPFGYLNFNPEKGDQFWLKVESVVDEKFEKMNIDDIVSIITSCLYMGIHPMKLIHRVFNAAYLSKLRDDEELRRKLHFIDTTLCLQCEGYAGPLLPKVQWSNSISQDGRIKNLLRKISDTLVKVAGSPDRMTTSVSIPHLYSDESNLIDVMLHPVGWKLTSAKNGNVAILIHLPEHYCDDGSQLLGPQIMRTRHFKLLGMKVISLKYLLLSKFQSTYSKDELEKYILDCINKDS